SQPIPFGWKTTFPEVLPWQDHGFGIQFNVQAAWYRTLKALRPDSISTTSRVHHRLFQLGPTTSWFVTCSLIRALLHGSSCCSGSIQILVGNIDLIGERTSLSRETRAESE